MANDIRCMTTGCDNNPYIRERFKTGPCPTCMGVSARRIEAIQEDGTILTIIEGTGEIVAHYSGVAHVWDRKSRTKSICRVCGETASTSILGSEPRDCRTTSPYTSEQARSALDATLDAHSIEMYHVAENKATSARGRAPARCPDCGNLPGYGYGRKLRDPRGCECVSSY